MKAVIMDIDGVLCHVPYAEGEPFDWLTHTEKDKDRVILEEGGLLTKMMMASGFHIIFLTARHEMMRDQTEEFLGSLGLQGTLVTTSSGNGEEYDIEDWQEVQAAQKRVAVETLSSHFEIMYAVDDQEPNCKMYREFGIPVLQARFL